MRRSTSRTNADRTGGMVSRATIETAADQYQMQQVDVVGLYGERISDVEHVHPYGFTAVPKRPTGTGASKKTAEAVVVFPTGNRSHALAVVVGDRRYRMTGLAEGEVAIHDDQGQSVHLTRDGMVLKTAGKALSIDTGGGQMTITGPLNVKGDVHIEGDHLTHNGHSVGSDHKHTDVAPGGALSGPPE